MKAWKSYFADIRGFFLDEKKSARTRTQEKIDADYWRDVRLSALQDFSEDHPALQTDEKSDDEQKKLSAIINEANEQAKREIYAREGSLAYSKAISMQKALVSLSAEYYKLLPDFPDGLDSFCNKILDVEPDLYSFNARHGNAAAIKKTKNGIKLYLNKIVPLSRIGIPLETLPLYDAPDTYYAERPAATRQKSIVAQVSRLSATAGMESIRRHLIATVSGQMPKLPMPTFSNTIGYSNVAKHPLSALSYAIDGITKVAFEYPAAIICRSVNAVVNGIYDGACWSINKTRELLKKPPLEFPDAHDTLMTQIPKVTLNTLLAGVFIAVRTVCFAVARSLGSSSNQLAIQKQVSVARRLERVKQYQLDDDEKIEYKPVHKNAFTRADTIARLNQGLKSEGKSSALPGAVQALENNSDVESKARHNNASSSLSPKESHDATVTAPNRLQGWIDEKQAPKSSMMTSRRVAVGPPRISRNKKSNLRRSSSTGGLSKGGANLSVVSERKKKDESSDK